MFNALNITDIVRNHPVWQALIFAFARPHSPGGGREEAPPPSKANSPLLVGDIFSESFGMKKRESLHAYASASACLNCVMNMNDITGVDKSSRF